MTDEELAAHWQSGASGMEISRVTGMSRSAILGRVQRRRKAGDKRFNPRPIPQGDRLAARRKRAVKAGATPAEARVMLPRAGRKVRPAHSLGAAATVLEAREDIGLPLWELEVDQCRFAVNSVDVGRGLDLRFCGRKIVRGQFCFLHSQIAYQPPVKRTAGTGGEFVLRAVTNGLG